MTLLSVKTNFWIPNSRIFAALSPVVQDDMWDEHWLAFEVVTNPKK